MQQTQQPFTKSLSFGALLLKRVMNSNNNCRWNSMSCLFGLPDWSLVIGIKFRETFGVSYNSCKLSHIVNRCERTGGFEPQIRS